MNGRACAGNPTFHREFCLRRLRSRVTKKNPFLSKDTNDIVTMIAFYRALTTQILFNRHDVSTELLKCQSPLDVMINGERCEAAIPRDRSITLADDRVLKLVIFE